MKTFIVEEHNEAFYVWNYCVARKIIPDHGNVLLHVDEHADMNIPRFNTSLTTLGDSLTGLKRFTYAEVGIATFIVPTLFQGYFKKVFWIKQQHQTPNRRARAMYVRSYNSEGKKLLTGRLTPAWREKSRHPESDLMLFDYYLRTLDTLPATRRTVLDIDLDYFSCSGNPNELKEISVEITARQYADYQANPYHRTRYIGPRVTVEQVGKRYFLHFNRFGEVYADTYPFTLKVDEGAIKQRVVAFIDKLAQRRVRPRLITVCRSRHSGYTPADQWQFIEEQLLDGLNSLYPVETISIDEI
jgi:hypothetical protein